jgi:hypothetical protein
MSIKNYRFAAQLGELLNGESPAITYTDIATRFNMDEPDVPDAVWLARKKLDKDHTPTMLVTEFYFVLDGDPKTPSEAERCCALHGRASAGIRRLFTRRNDSLGRTWIRLNQRCASGLQSHNLDRIAIEHSLKNLSLKRAGALVTIMRQVLLPYHQTEYQKLMKKITEQLGNGE